MSDDKVRLVFIGTDVELIHIPPAGSDPLNPGPLVACGRGWQQEMSRAKAEKIVGSRPDFFKIEELL